MEDLKQTVASMTDLFHSKMASFRSDLVGASSISSGPTVISLAKDFAAFESFIEEALKMLQQQIQLLSQQMDQHEMRSRRKILLLHGVPQEKDEDTARVVLNIVSKHLKMHNIGKDDISRSHRMGRQVGTGSSPRPLLIKFKDVLVRDQIWYAKTKLKGTGVTATEFLTKSLHDLFMAGRRTFGIANCWTKDGRIYAIDTHGTRHQIKCTSDLNNLASSQKSPVDTPSPVVDKSKSKLKRRVVASKK